ncbi:hypothetical protein RRG08_052861 [Elysia crispata]|uniref:Uncharacterized protein n=1 Tax=Elysia crispata TaxID=231223 RepID=A0AAE0XU67_9GAST|nr:hypothetical protein RRG08_052861 [Elysia crispata]
MERYRWFVWSARFTQGKSDRVSIVTTDDPIKPMFRENLGGSRNIIAICACPFLSRSSSQGCGGRRREL